MMPGSPRVRAQASHQMLDPRSLREQGSRSPVAATGGLLGAASATTPHYLGGLALEAASGFPAARDPERERWGPRFLQAAGPLPFNPIGAVDELLATFEGADQQVDRLPFGPEARALMQGAQQHATDVGVPWPVQLGAEAVAPGPEGKVGALAGVGARLKALGALDPSMATILAFVGSPRQWDINPDLSRLTTWLKKLGTGEGAQVRGHGNYSAQQRRTAKTYAQAEDRPLLWRGKPLDSIYGDDIRLNFRDELDEFSGTGDPNGRFSAVQQAANLFSTRRAPVERDEMVAMLSEIAQFGSLADADRAMKYSIYEDTWKAMRHEFANDPAADAALYGVIHDVKESDLLDLDAALEDRPDVLKKLQASEDPDVQRALFALGTPQETNELSLHARLHAGEKLTGHMFQQNLFKLKQAKAHQAVADAFNAPLGEISSQSAPVARMTQMMVSDAINAAGVPGNKFFDGFSRNPDLHASGIKEGKLHGDADMAREELGGTPTRGLGAAEAREIGGQNLTTWSQAKHYLNEASIVRDGSAGDAETYEIAREMVRSGITGNPVLMDDVLHRLDKWEEAGVALKARTGGEWTDRTRNYVMFRDDLTYVDPERTSPSLLEGLSEDEIARPWRTTGPGETPEPWRNIDFDAADAEGQLTDRELYGEWPEGSRSHFSRPPKTDDPIRVAKDFAGADTIGMALGDADISTVAAREFDDDIVAWNKSQGSPFDAQDVTEADAAELANADHYHASPVCKNLSCAKVGRDLDALDEASAQKVADNIAEARPPTVTIENVPDYQDTVLMDDITNTLDDEGYIWDVVEIDAADYGGASSRKRMILRAVREGELPPLPEKTGPTDWYETIEDLIDDAPDSEFRGTGGNPNKELEGIRERFATFERTNGKHGLDPSQPVITMGGWESARNPGKAAPTLPASNQLPRILMPDGRIKQVTPRMMARLMGIADDVPIPDDYYLAKKVLGNGIHGEVSRNILLPMAELGRTIRRGE